MHGCAILVHKSFRVKARLLIEMCSGTPTCGALLYFTCHLVKQNDKIVLLFCFLCCTQKQQGAYWQKCPTMKVLCVGGLRPLGRKKKNIFYLDISNGLLSVAYFFFPPNNWQSSWQIGIMFNSEFDNFAALYILYTHTQKKKGSLCVGIVLDGWTGSKF